MRIEKHQVQRFWKFIDHNSQLVYIYVFKQGAVEVVRRLTEKKEETDKTGIQNWKVQ